MGSYSELCCYRAAWGVGIMASIHPLTTKAMSKTALQHLPCPALGEERVHPSPRGLLTSAAKRCPLTVCSEPGPVREPQCRCSCTARYCWAKPPVMASDSGSSRRTAGVEGRGQSVKHKAQSITQVHRGGVSGE